MSADTLSAHTAVDRLPNCVGLSLKAQHYIDILDTLPAIGWWEIHPENYMGEGGLPHYYLQRIAQHYPISMHAVGLSLGSAEGVDAEHLAALARLVERYQPAQLSEHLAWSRYQGHFFNDLLPLPYTQNSLDCFVRNVQQTQETLQRRILIENPSIYTALADQDMSEIEFLQETVQRTGCGLLLDINNVYVSANNLGFCPQTYLKQFPLAAVDEIHLAGHTSEMIENERVCIDNHGSQVSDAVLALYCTTLTQARRRIPTLLEWDTDVPSLSVFLQQAQRILAAVVTALPCKVEPNDSHTQLIAPLASAIY